MRSNNEVQKIAPDGGQRVIHFKLGSMRMTDS
jgi:hypothetical protein